MITLTICMPVLPHVLDSASVKCVCVQTPIIQCTEYIVHVHCTVYIANSV